MKRLLWEHMPQYPQYDHYKLLGLGRNSSASQLKVRFRSLAKRYHPDVNGSPRAAEVFRAIHEAYRVLSDAQLRKEYDELLDRSRPVQQRPTQDRVVRRPIVRPPTPVDVFAYRGLHVTGLLFGSVLIGGILIGTTFLDWPFLTLIFCLPGMAVIPDSLEGLRQRRGQAGTWTNHP
ncbi:MAG: J domain-containing protein [Flavobacteriales bacterium]|nr:J domain-containing protein [Flavobacteriales bacterium]